MDLAPNEVFVFGSNMKGFHGAGGAGLACRGESFNTWRKDPWFLKAMNSPPDSADRIGKWAIFGCACGFQEGREGKSYAIVTVTRPGDKRSISLADIKTQLDSLWDFAEEHPEWTFLITPLGEGYAGYSHEEMQQIWTEIQSKKGPRPNWKFIRPEENVT